MTRSTSLRPSFSANPDFDFEIRCVLGGSVAGAADIGEVLAAVAHVGPHDHVAWHAAWAALAERTRAAADAAAAAGHAVSAAEGYLRASGYFAVAVNAQSALPDDPGDPSDPDGAGADPIAAAFTQQQDAWRAFVAHVDADVTAVETPYEGRTLPGWFFRAGTATPAGTVVAVNGSDGSLAAMWAGCAFPALARGYHVLLFDGPGQQSELFERKVPFRPDWEHVLTPVYDFVAGFEGVDPERIAVYGMSQGGNWVARAVAFEHRFAAAITDPGVVDVSTSWTAQIPAPLMKTLDARKVDTFDKEMAREMRLSPATARTWRFRARPYGTTGYGETIREVRRYTVADVAGQITTPLLVLSPDNEQFWPGQAEQLAALTAGVSTLVPFTAAEGADGHCQPMARTLTAQRMFDWLDAVLETTPTG